jgi:hypothetical protein
MTYGKLGAFAAAVLALLGLLSPPAAAQTTGDIRGNVVDSSNTPLPGVTIEIRSPTMLGVRSTITDRAGDFRFRTVPPGTYSLTATLSGFTKLERTDIRVLLSETATVSLVLRISRTEKVVVTGETPAVDTASTTAGSTYTAEVIDKLPVGRNYADVVRLQPGVQEDNGETQGRSLALSIYGSTSAENLFLIDGVNTTNVIKGIQGKAINAEFVEEVEIKTGGYQAQYGRNTGGVVNVITKQGGNEFHGNVFGYFDNAGMHAQKTVLETPDYSQSGDVQVSNLFPTNTRAEGGLSLGGYILKDRIWFFGAYDKVRVDRETQPLAGVNAGKTFPQTFDSNLYSAKLTSQITSSTELQASVFADPQTNGGSIYDNPLGTSPSSYLGTYDIGGQDYAVRLNQILGSRGVVTLQYGHHKDRYMLTGSPDQAVVDATAQVLFGEPRVNSGGIGDIWGPGWNNQSTRDIALGSVSWLLGKHEIKVGGDYQKDTTNGASYETGGSLLFIYPCRDVANYQCDLSKAPIVQTAAGTIPVFYQHYYYSPSVTDLTPMAAAPFSVPSRFWSVYIQDEWKLLPNLVVDLGLRYDDQRVYKGNGDVAFDLKSQWSPRVGFSWDFLKNGTSKLYGSFGRYYYALPTDLAVRVYTANTWVLNTNYSASSLEQDHAAPRGQIVQGGSFEGEPVDPGLKASYQDEYTIGVEKAIGRTFSVGARYMYRTLGRTIEDRCDLDPSDPASDFSSCALMNPGGSGPAASGQIRTCNGTGNPLDPTAGECTSPGVAIPAATRKFQGFEVLARKQVGDSFWAQASYLYSKLEGNYSGAISTQSGQTDPGINVDFDYYQLAYNSYGRLELDRPHSFILTGAYAFPFGLTASAGCFLRSGTPYGVRGWFNDIYPSNLYLVPRGSAGRTPTDWDASLSLAYNFRIGDVTITPQFFLFQVFNNQVVTAYDSRFNPLGTFVGNPTSSYYGQAGVEPGTGACPAGGNPCTDNVDYMKATARSNPRVFRVALKISF